MILLYTLKMNGINRLNQILEESSFAKNQPFDFHFEANFSRQSFLNFSFGNGVLQIYLKFQISN